LEQAVPRRQPEAMHRSRVAPFSIVVLALFLAAGCGSPAPSPTQIAAAESAARPTATTPAATEAPTEAAPAVTPNPSSPEPTLAPVGRQITWQQAISSDDGSKDAPRLGSITDAVAFGDGFVLSGSEMEGQRAVIWYSPDGATWQAIDSAPGFSDGVIDMVVPLGDGLIAIGTGYGLDSRCTANAVGCNPVSPIRLWTSPDGRNWHALPAAASKGLGRAQLGVVIPGPKGLLAFGVVVPVTGDHLTPMVWTSPNGRSWTAATQFGRSYSQDTIFAMTAGAGGYVAAGSFWAGGHQGTPRKIWYSANGKFWHPASGLADGDGPSIVLPCAGGYLGVDDGSAGAQLWTSADGRKWLLQPAVSNRPDYPLHLGLGVYSDGQRVLAMGSDFYSTREAWLSTDGRDWNSYSFRGASLTAESAIVGALGPKGVVVATNTNGSAGQALTIWFGSISG
jgi:hypothetical protein